jgi:hypothetical protein
MAFLHSSRRRKSRSVVSVCHTGKPHQQLCNTPLTFDQTLYKYDRPDERFVTVTTAFLRALHQERLTHASLVRISATVRHGAC